MRSRLLSSTGRRLGRRRNAELARLRKQVAEREILRKAAAYFARETLD